MVILIILLNFDVFLKKPKLILKVIVTAFITLLVTAFYWIPVLEQFMSNTFYVSKPWIEPIQEAVKVSSVFSFAFPTLGIGLLILLLPRFLLFRNEEDKIMKFSDQCMATGLVFAVLSTEIVPWETIGKWFPIVQFPWRLFIVSTVLFAFSAAVVVYRLAGSLCIGVTDTPDDYDDEVQVVTNDTLVNKYGAVLGIVLVVMMVSALYGMSLQEREYFDFSEDYYDYKPFTATVIAGEWLPLTVTEPSKLTDHSDYATDSNGKDITVVRNKGEVSVTVDGSEEYIDVPLVYYKGYAAKGADGTSYRIDGSGENGLTRVYTDGKSDTIRVFYQNTSLTVIADILSIVVISGIIFISHRKRKSNKSSDSDKENS